MRAPKRPETGRRPSLGLAALLAAAALGLAGPVAHAATGAAQPEVDLALVLAVDVSLSVDAGRYRLQRDGIAAALGAPEVARAIAAGPRKAVAVAVMEFSDPDRAVAVIDWAVLRSAADAGHLASRVHRLRRSSDGLTGLGNALVSAAALIEAAPVRAARRVIDVSGTASRISAWMWRRRATPCWRAG